MKIRNVVWLTLEDQTALEKAHAPLKDIMATNEYVVQVLKFVLSNQELQKQLIQQVGKEKQIQALNITEKVVETVKLVKEVSMGCPFCSEDFSKKGQKYLREHILSKHLKGGVE